MQLIIASHFYNCRDGVLQSSEQQYSERHAVGWNYQFSHKHFLWICHFFGPRLCRSHTAKRSQRSKYTKKFEYSKKINVVLLRNWKLTSEIKISGCDAWSWASVCGLSRRNFRNGRRPYMVNTVFCNDHLSRLGFSILHGGSCGHYAPRHGRCEKVKSLCLNFLRQA